MCRKTHRHNSRMPGSNPWKLGYSCRLFVLMPRPQRLAFHSPRSLVTSTVTVCSTHAMLTRSPHGYDGKHTKPDLT